MNKIPRSFSRLNKAVKPWAERLGKMDTRSAMEHAAKKRQTSVSMQTLLDTGRGKHLGNFGTDGEDDDSDKMEQVQNQIASFLYREMPVRFAHRARELSSLPHGLCEQPSIKEVRNWYVQSFEDIVTMAPPTTEDDEALFYTTMDSIYKRHAETQVTIAYGLQEFKRSQATIDSGKKLHHFEDIHRFLDSFSISRIGIRMLIGQYLEIAKERPDWVGMICENTSPSDITSHAVEHASFMCDREFGFCPDVNIRGRTDMTFNYVPSHLYYILFELLKNSMRATCEKHYLEDDMPDIEIIIGDGEDNEDVIIKISDQGGGIRRSQWRYIFSYLFTTAREEAITESAASKDFGTEGPLAGLGYGLPISRAHARYFGGDLQVISMEGYGTDAFLYLSRLNHHDEPLL